MCVNRVCVCVRFPSVLYLECNVLWTLEPRVGGGIFDVGECVSWSLLVFV